MIISQILKFLDSTKTQKCKFLETETLFFLQTNKFIYYTLNKGYNMAKIVLKQGQLLRKKHTTQDWPATIRYGVTRKLWRQR